MKGRSPFKVYSFVQEHIAYRVALELANFRSVIWRPTRPRQLQTDATDLMVQDAVKRTARQDNTALINRGASAWAETPEIVDLALRHRVRLGQMVLAPRGFLGAPQGLGRLGKKKRA